MFSARSRVGKAFAVEQKIGELKKLLLKNKVVENNKRNNNRKKPNKSMKKATTNLNNTISAKYGISPEFKEIYNFHRLNKVKGDLERRERLGINSDDRKNNKLRETLNTREKVLVSAERLKKKYAPVNF